MCFYINGCDDSNPRIATEDIISYKVGYRTTRLALIDGRTEEIEVFKSEYHDYIYRLNSKQPEIQLNPVYDTQLNCDVIHRGYHSYPDLTTASLNTYSDQVIAKCIIPKGSTYYHNKVWDEYVSTSLIITDFLTD